MREIEWQQYGQTVIDPLALTFTLTMGVWLLFAKREQAVLPIALVLTLIPAELRLVIATLDFDMGRILILFGLVRLLTRGEYRSFRWHPLDVALLAWMLAGTLIHVARVGSTGALVYRLGFVFNVCGIYFLLRMVLRDSAEVFRALRSLAAIAAIVAVFMINEAITARNVFSIFGGVPEITSIRDGRLRCTGAFSHPIMAGTFGATLAPIMLMLFFAGRKHKTAFAIGFLAASVIAITAASSGAAMAWGAGVVACGLWRARKWLRPIRASVVAMIVIIHILWQHPVWFLIGRVSNVVGGTGYHRVRLIDGFVENWTEWFLLGTNSTAHWGWGLQDLTNQFVYEGVRGGFLTLVAFILVLVRSFQSVGRVRVRAGRARHLAFAHRRRLQFLSWGLGVTLATHCVSWISVSYFGQMNLVLYMHFAFIAALDQTPELAPLAFRRARQQRHTSTAVPRMAPAPVLTSTGAPSGIGSK